MTNIITDKKKIEEALTRGVEEVIVEEHLKKRLLKGKRLRIKLGIDPTGSILHLGHAVVLRKLKEFQDLGHQIIFLIGDFTARIGDPTGRVSVRKTMTKEDIEKNMKTYIDQAGIILDMDRVEVRYNSEWLDKLNLQDSIMLMSKITYAQMAQRADFKTRIKNDIDLSLQEFLYPAMQGYDSVALRADIEFGGTDQKFNLLMGRHLQKRYNQKPQDIITCPLLEGLSGSEKMSKSLDNYVALNEEADEMYGKIMSLTDNLIVRYFELCTYLPMSEIKDIKEQLKGGKVNPRDVKMRLGREIVSIYHDDKSAKGAEEQFIKTFQKKEVPDEIDKLNVESADWKLVDLLFEVKLVESKGEARRLIKQNGIKVDGKVVSDINNGLKIPENGILLQRGKRRFLRIVSNSHT